MKTIGTKIYGRTAKVRPVDHLEAQELLNAGHTIYAHPSNMEVPTPAKPNSWFVWDALTTRSLAESGIENIANYVSLITLEYSNKMFNIFPKFYVAL